MNTAPSSFYSIGQKVICINDAFPPAVADWCDHLPIAGCIYTIRDWQIATDQISGLSNMGYLLEEIVNPESSLGCEAGFWHNRFVPWLDVCVETEHNDAGEPAQLQEAL